MNSTISRRHFVAAASSLGPVVMSDLFHLFANTGHGHTTPGKSVGRQQRSDGDVKPRILVFDVIQTMLDLNALRPAIRAGV
jgi:2-haloacid dehalogenase